MKLELSRPGSGDDSDGWTWGDRFTYLLAEYKWHLMVFAVAGALFAYHAKFGIPSWDELPRSLRITLIAIPLGGAAGFYPAKLVVDKYFTLVKIRVNEVDASRGGDREPEQMGIARSWDVPPVIWEDKEVIEGAPYLNADGEWNVERLEWDGETLRIWGPWKGEMNSTQLETWYHALSETQGRQRFWMQAGKALKMRLPSWLRSMEQSITERVTRMTMEMSTDSLEIYEDEVVARAESMTESVDVPEGYYSSDFAEEVEGEIESNIDEATDGAWSKLDESGDSDE